MSGPPRSCRKCSRTLCVLSKPASKKWLHSKGSCIIYLGRTLHSGGENRSAQGIDRWGLNVDYNLGWLRQEVNQYLDVPPHVARTLPPQIQVRRSMHQDSLLNPRNYFFYPFFTHFPPFFAHFQRLDARNPENTTRSPGENGKKSIKIG